MNTHFIYGLHAARALLETQPELIQTVYVQHNRNDERMNSLLKLVEQCGISCHERSRNELTQLAKQAEHQGVVIECKQLPQYQESDLPKLISKTEDSNLILVLDGVQDPHNLGACLRSANAFGVALVIIPKNNSAAITPVVRKVACGAAEVTPVVQVTNLARSLRFLQEEGYWVVGAAADSTQDLSVIDLKGKIVLVMGSEGGGLRRLTKEHCDFLIRIPMCGSVSSLNVSVASAICLYEAARQRRAG